MKYKASLKPLVKNKTNSKFIVLISVGQNPHYGDKFVATVNALSDRKPKKVTIMLADTLQRHNYTFTNHNKAYQYSKELGDEWIRENEPILKNSKLNYKIERWDTYLNHNSFTIYHQKIKDLYRKDHDFQKAIDNTVYSFLSRKFTNSSISDVEFNNCLNYLLEECPIIIPLSIESGYDAIIYPKEMTEAMAYTLYLIELEDKHKTINWYSIRFKKTNDT